MSVWSPGSLVGARVLVCGAHIVYLCLFIQQQLILAHIPTSCRIIHWEVCCRLGSYALMVCWGWSLKNSHILIPYVRLSQSQRDDHTLFACASCAQRESLGAWRMPLLKWEATHWMMTYCRRNGGKIASYLHLKNACEWTKARLGTCSYGHNLFRFNMIKLQN